jgi:glycosyltransferase involved in cell wall biosynthesis
MDKISIIIPVYNVGPYIRKCLDSVVNQTFKNIEIICVNDGSTDNSAEICEEYAKIDSRIKVIHKTNGGNASAVNAGLNEFTGDYVGFVDPDDWIEQEYFEHAYQLITNNNVDFVCFGWYKDTLESSIEIKNHLPIESGKLNRNQILRYTFIRDAYPAFCAYRWNKLFRAYFFKSVEKNGYQIRAQEDLEVLSDVLFFTECILKTNNAIFCDSAFYHYFQRESSLSYSKDLEKKKGRLIAYARIIDLLEINDINTEIIIWVKRFYVYHASLLTELALSNKDGVNLALMQNEIRRYLTEYMVTNEHYPDRINRINLLLETSISRDH